MKPWRSRHLEAAVREVGAAVRAAGLTPKAAEAMAREELRLIARLGGTGEKYGAVRELLEALCSRTA